MEDKILGIGASLIPQCGYAELSILILLIISSVLHNASIHIPDKKIIPALPSAKRIQSVVTEHAIDTMVLTRKNISENLNVLISVDKGNTKGNKNLAKFLCWYDKDGKYVKPCMLDFDCLDEHTTDVYEGIRHSLTRFFE